MFPAPKNEENGALKTHFLRTCRGLETLAFALTGTCTFVFATCRVEFVAQSNVGLTAIVLLVYACFKVIRVEYDVISGAVEEVVYAYSNGKAVVQERFSYREVKCTGGSGKLSVLCYTLRSNFQASLGYPIVFKIKCIVPQYAPYRFA